MYTAAGSHFVPLAYWNVNSDNLLPFWALAASVVNLVEKYKAQRLHGS